MLNMNLLELRNKLQLSCDNTSNSYYSDQCDKLKKSDLEVVTIQLYGYDGGITNNMTLNKESLIALIDLMIRQGVN